MKKNVISTQLSLHLQHISLVSFQLNCDGRPNEELWVTVKVSKDLLRYYYLLLLSVCL